MQLPYNPPSSVSSAPPAFPAQGDRKEPRAKVSPRVGMASTRLRATWGPSKGQNAPVTAAQEKRRRRRVPVPPMYTNLTLRNLALRSGPIEGYIVDVSEHGMAIEADSLVPIGQTVTVEFQIAGVGTLRRDSWPEFAAAAEVVRHDNLDDFPCGPYRMALRFVKVSTMAQAQIARYIATQP
jgi:hypothetical protein